MEHTSIQKFLSEVIIAFYLSSNVTRHAILRIYRKLGGVRDVAYVIISNNQTH